MPRAPRRSHRAQNLIRPVEPQDAGVLKKIAFPRQSGGAAISDFGRDTDVGGGGGGGGGGGVSKIYSIRLQKT